MVRLGLTAPWPAQHTATWEGHRERHPAALSSPLCKDVLAKILLVNFHFPVNQLFIPNNLNVICCDFFQQNKFKNNKFFEWFLKQARLFKIILRVLGVYI